MGFPQNTYKLEHVPVEHVVVREALSVEEVSEELSQVRVVGLVVEAQRAAEVKVRGELRCRGERREKRSVRIISMIGSGATTPLFQLDICTVLFCGRIEFQPLWSSSDRDLTADRDVYKLTPEPATTNHSFTKCLSVIASLLSIPYQFHQGSAFQVM